VSVYATYHVTHASHDTDMHTSSMARLRSSRSASIASMRIRVESLERLIEDYTGEQRAGQRKREIRENEHFFTATPLTYPSIITHDSQAQG
jgi:hypothetical protein